MGSTSLLAGADVVIHLTAIIREDSWPEGVDEDLNVKGMRSLLESARRQGVRRFIFVSSQSSSFTAPTRFGRGKWAIEQMLDGAQEIIVKPGMATGGSPRVVDGLLLRLCKQFPILPIVRPDAPIYPIHVDDLCEALLDLAMAPGAPPKIVHIAPREPMPFGQYVHRIAWERLGFRVRLVPIPASWILFASRLTEIVSFLPTVSRERVMGLIALPKVDFSTAPSTLAVQSGRRDPFHTLSREGLH